MDDRFKTNHPKYKDVDLSKIDDYVLRKISEHLRIERLAKDNSEVLTFKVVDEDKQFPHPPIAYEILFKLNSFIGVDKKEKQPISGNTHILRIKVPNIFPEQFAESKMLSPTWHPNIKSSGPFEGDICTNHKGFGTLYHLDELIVRIGEYLQYKRYLAENRKPWPEDPKVARWVREFAEPEGLVNKEEGKFTDYYSWIISFDDVFNPESNDDDDDDDDFIEIIEKNASK